MDKPRLDAEQVREEVLGAKLGDERLSQRLVEVSTALARKPDQSFPKAMEGEAQLEAAYRLLSNPKVSAERLLRPHVERTCERARQCKRVLVVFDTTEVRVGGEREELGFLSHEKGRGFYAHVGLVVDADTRDPQGVLHCENTFRRGKPKRRKQGKGAADSEAWRWHQGVERARELLPEAICVMDREADMYSLVQQMQQAEQSFVVRAAHNRVTDEGKLWDLLDELSTISTRNVSVSERRYDRRRDGKRKTHAEHSAHTAVLHVRARAVRLRNPQVSSAPSADRRTDGWVEANLVHVIEPSPPQGDEPVEWLLLTNLPITTAAEVDFVVTAYRCRWLIEEFFKVLKTNCALEKRQMETEQTMSNVLALSLPIAWLLLRLREHSRQTPDQPASGLLPETMMLCLRLLYATRRKRELPEHPTCRDLTWAIAALGGHIRNNGEPGTIVLARGMADLLAAVQVVDALKREGKM
ncbi:MAG TPA: IS4 family transposase [Polyangiales bacterium]|jgi:hypothetical protein|nr:IS4 family transposase [Polyangiales bacterium]